MAGPCPGDTGRTSKPRPCCSRHSDTYPRHTFLLRKPNLHTLRKTDANFRLELNSLIAFPFPMQPLVALLNLRCEFREQGIRHKLPARPISAKKKRNPVPDRECCDRLKDRVCFHERPIAPGHDRGKRGFDYHSKMLEVPSPGKLPFESLPVPAKATDKIIDGLSLYGYAVLEKGD